MLAWRKSSRPTFHRLDLFRVVVRTRIARSQHRRFVCGSSDRLGPHIQSSAPSRCLLGISPGAQRSPLGGLLDMSSSLQKGVQRQYQRHLNLLGWNKERWIGDQLMTRLILETQFFHRDLVLVSGNRSHSLLWISAWVVLSSAVHYCPIYWSPYATFRNDCVPQYEGQNALYQIGYICISTFCLSFHACKTIWPSSIALCRSLARIFCS